MSQILSKATFVGLIGIAVTGGAYYATSSPPEEPKASHVMAAPKPISKPRAVESRAWGGLSERELDDIHDAIKGLTPKVRVDIYCGGNFCRELAEDFDEAFESAGFDSYIEVPLMDTGKGAGMSPDNPQVRKIAATIKAATAGRVDLEVFDLGSKHLADGRIVVVLARKTKK